MASKVAEAHKEILEGEKFDISKERTFLVIRFLFDDILAKLNPTDQKIDKTRIQQCYVTSRTEEDGIKRSKLVQGVLAKRLSALPQFKQFTAGELLQAARVTCIDAIGEEFAKRYAERLAGAKDGQDRDSEEVKKEQESFKFVLDQLTGLGVGASIAFGVDGRSFFQGHGGICPGAHQVHPVLQEGLFHPDLGKNPVFPA